MATGIREWQGVTIGFSSTSVTLNLLDISMDGVSKGDINTSDQGTTGGETYVATTLTEYGTYTCNVNWNNYDHAALMTAVAAGTVETITFTYPKVVSTDATAPSDAFSGYINQLSKNGGKGDLAKGVLRFKVTGAITSTDGSAV